MSCRWRATGTGLAGSVLAACATGAAGPGPELAEGRSADLARAIGTDVIYGNSGPDPTDQFQCGVGGDRLEDAGPGGRLESPVVSEREDVLVDGGGTDELRN